MKTVKTLIIPILLAACLLVSCKKDEDKKAQEPGGTSSKPGKQTQEIIVRSKGLGTDCVAEFFRLWKSKNYMGMHELTVNSRERDWFVRFMKDSLVNFRKVVINKESGNGNDLKVELLLEVTDPPSFIAATWLNLEGFGVNYETEKAALFGPGFYEFETFMNIKQTWHLKKVEGRYKINVGARDPKVGRKGNIMNYVLDSSCGLLSADTNNMLRKLPKKTFVTLNLSEVCSSCELNLDVSKDESGKWFEQAKTKREKGIEKIEKLQNMRK